MTKLWHSLRRSASVGLVLLLGLLISGCPFAPVQTVILGENDSGGDVTMRVGARLIVVLRGNASTGYEWELAELDGSVVEHTDWSSQYGCAASVDGCAHTERWTYTALSPGSTTLRMIYHQPWEEVEPARTFELSVTVTGSE